MVGAVTGRTVPVTIRPLDSWQEAIQRRHQVVVRPCSDLHDDDTRRRVRHEDRQEAVAAGSDLGEERGTVSGQIVEPAPAPRPDGQLPRVYGKMLRIASRMRPSPPPAGADS